MNERLQLARQIAREAGQLTLDYFGQSIDFQRKPDRSPVTIADHGAEQLLRRRIQAAFPDDGIIGEEFGSVEGRSGYRWILDPIDGTKAFICGVPLYGTLIGVERNGQGQIGVIELPALDRSVYAATGQGAWQVEGDKQPQPARVSDAVLADGLVVTSEIETFAEVGVAGFFPRLEQSSWFVRTWGDCYGYYLVATGRAVAMIDPALNHWDAAAVKPIMEEAGGTFTDFGGNRTATGGNGIGTNGKVLPEILALLRECGSVGP